jgi:hypothetical protein
MPASSIRPAFESWPRVNQLLRDSVRELSADQLAVQPSGDRWPMWASIGHLACQRVFWLCDFAGAPGADTTPFPNAAFNCPGDDDLETVLGGEQLAAALDSTFRIVEECLDTWTPESLTEVISHPDWGEGMSRPRGWALTRVFGHDLWHIAELNEALGRAGLPLVEPW